MFPRNSFGIPWKHLTVLTDAFDLKLLHSLNAHDQKCQKS
jgi:hypothetical protein